MAGLWHIIVSIERTQFTPLLMDLPSVVPIMLACQGDKGKRRSQFEVLVFHRGIEYLKLTRVAVRNRAQGDEDKHPDIVGVQLLPPSVASEVSTR